MQTAGIIAEYNPFHNGHAYHIQKTKELTGADHVVIVMSGDFTQRGTPALFDKYARTQMALDSGADLVLELPYCYASSSAEYFSGGAVSLLDGLGVTQTLCFGSECGDIQLLQNIAAALLEQDHTAGFSNTLKTQLRQGRNFPAARCAALMEHTSLPQTPNDILGMEYCKALYNRSSCILPYTIQRFGSGYHETSLSPDIPLGSALAVRKALASQTDPHEILPFLPAVSHSFFLNLLSGPAVSGFGGPLSEDDFSLLLHYRLLTMSHDNMNVIADMTENLADKLLRNRDTFTGWHDFCLKLNSKDLTYTRLSRCFSHILTGLMKEDLAQRKADAYPVYARILGFKQNSPVLAAVKKKSGIPVISKLADGAGTLDGVLRSMLEEDIQASHLYQAAVSSRYHTRFMNEYTRRIIIK